MANNHSTDSFANIRCVVFDLDDTLWPCEPTIINAEIALYEWLAENYAKITQQFSFEDIREHRAEFAKKNKRIAHDVTSLRKESLAELAIKFEYPLQMADEGLALFRKHRNRVEFFSDALPTLSKLAKHFKIGAITNGNADLEAIGARQYFDFVVTAQDAGVAKPDEKIFAYAQEKSNYACHELIYVGDHPAIDMLGCIKSGWKSLWFNPEETPWPEDALHKNYQPDAQIQKLSQLPKLLVN